MTRVLIAILILTLAPTARADEWATLRDAINQAKARADADIATHARAAASAEAEAERQRLIAADLRAQLATRPTTAPATQPAEPTSDPTGDVVAVAAGADLHAVLSNLAPGQTVVLARGGYYKLPGTNLPEGTDLHCRGSVLSYDGTERGNGNYGILRIDGDTPTSKTFVRDAIFATERPRGEVEVQCITHRSPGELYTINCGVLERPEVWERINQGIEVGKQWAALPSSKRRDFAKANGVTFDDLRVLSRFGAQLQRGYAVGASRERWVEAGPWYDSDCPRRGPTLSYPTAYGGGREGNRGVFVSRVNGFTVGAYYRTNQGPGVHATVEDCQWTFLDVCDKAGITYRGAQVQGKSTDGSVTFRRIRVEGGSQAIGPLGADDAPSPPTSFVDFALLRQNQVVARHGAQVTYSRGRIEMLPNTGNVFDISGKSRVYIEHVAIEGDRLEMEEGLTIGPGVSFKGQPVSQTGS